MINKHAIVAIDGPSGSGKSTISRMLAHKLGFTYLDTGAMYRAVGLKAKRAGIDLDDTEALAVMLKDIEIHLAPKSNDDVRVFLDGEDVSAEIRTAEMGMVASKVSANMAVRKKLTKLQQDMGRKGAIVAEGRDMGTVVFPGADFKFFLDASPEERARRRCEQLKQRGEEADYQEILEQITKRDEDDSSRALAPLKPAKDAIIVDSSKMNPDEVLAFMIQCFKREFGVL